MMMKRRWSSWLQTITKKTLGMRRMPMCQGLLEVLTVEPAVVFYIFYFRFILFSETFGLSCKNFMFLILSTNFCVLL